jgi:hypothetical protein
VVKGAQASTKHNTAREKIIELRKQNLSIYDISRTLREDNQRLSPAAVARLLRDAGFAKLPWRAEEERATTPRPEAAAIADERQLDLSQQHFRTYQLSEIAGTVRAPIRRPWVFATTLSARHELVFFGVTAR